MKAVSFIWTRVGDVTHNYRESNNLFFLWIALVTEKLERIAQGEGSFLLGQRGRKGESQVNISRQANQHVEPKPTLNKFIVFTPLFFIFP